MAKTNPFSSIHQQVEKVYRRLAYQSLLHAVCCAIATLSLCVLSALFIFGSWEPSQDDFYWTIGFITACTSAVFFITLGISLKRCPSVEKAAEFWESVQPELKDGLIACIHFEKSWETDFRGSRDQGRQLAQWVEEKIQSKSIADIVPWTRVRRGPALILFAGVLWGLGALVAMDRIADGFDSLHWDVTPESGFVYEPLVGDIHITVDPPPYTGQPRRFIPNSSGTIQVMEGAKLTIRAVSTEPIKQAFAIVGADEFSGVVTSEREFNLSFNVSGAIDWRFGIVTTDGTQKVEGDSRRITIIPDRAPTVEMTQPDSDMELENVRAVPVVFDARDDIGLSKVAIQIALAGDENNSEEIIQEGFSGRRALGSDEIDLTVIEAQAGDRIAVWVSAQDNREMNGPQNSQSNIRYITIRSPEFNHYEITEALHELVGRLLDTLASRLETDFLPQTQSVVGTTRTLNTQTAETIDEAEILLARMIKDPLTAEEITSGFRRRLDALSRTNQQEQTSLQRYPSATTTISELELENVVQGNEGVVKELEEMVIYVEAMVSRLALEDIAAMTDEIRAAKARLTDLINAYKTDRSDALKARIMRNVKRLKSRIQELRARMAKLRQKMPEEFLNMEGLKSGEVQQGLSDTQDQLDTIEQMLEEDRLDDAMKALEEMSETLDGLSEALNQDMQNLHDQTNPQLQKALSKLMDEARDLYKRQEGIAQSTQQRADEDAKKRQALLEREMKDQMKDIMALAETFRGTVDELAGKDFPSYAEEYLAELQEYANGIIKALDVQRLIGALEAAKAAEASLFTLRGYARINRGQNSPIQTIRLALAQDLALIKAIEELLKKIEQQLNQERDGSSMEQLRQSQQALSESARRLRQMMNQNSQMIPGLKGKPMDAMDQAQKSMNRAQKSLGKGQPQHAQSNQSDALSQLKGLMQGLKQASKPQNQRQNSDGEGQKGRRKPSSEKVKIPTAEDHEAPAEFRKELMDAMKEKPPEAYRESVRRYYESLVE